MSFLRQFMPLTKLLGGLSVEKRNRKCNDLLLYVTARHIPYSRGVSNFLNLSTDVTFESLKWHIYQIIHLWKGNESQNPFLISNFTKMLIFLRKPQKVTFLAQKFWDKLTKKNTKKKNKSKMFKLQENYAKTHA